MVRRRLFFDSEKYFIYLLSHLLVAEESPIILDYEYSRQDDSTTIFCAWQVDPRTVSKY
jgi:hypothetical protein